MRDGDIWGIQRKGISSVGSRYQATVGEDSRLKIIE
jgi:hypothetical protein